MKHGMSPRKKKVLIILGIVLGVLVALLLIAVLFINGKMNLLNRSASYQPVSSLTADDEQLDFDQVNLDDIDVMKNGGEIAPPDGDVNVNKDVTNILLIGSDERTEDISTEARADSIMLLSINSKTNEWKLASFERGVGVSIPNHGDDWLTHTFAYGGPDLLLSAIREYYKVDVSKYVRVNFTIFETGVTDIGGVEVDMTEAEAKYMNQIAGKTRWEAGLQRLDGPTALVYARMRHLDSDWNRVARQRKVLQAAADQIATLSPAKINLIADKLLPMIETNLTNGDLWQLAFKMPALLGGVAGQMTVPDRSNCWGIKLDSGRTLIGCDFAAEAERLNTFLLTGEDVDASSSDASSDAALDSFGADSSAADSSSADSSSADSSYGTGGSTGTSRSTSVKNSTSRSTYGSGSSNTIN